MKLSIWQQFSSNHSGSYFIVGVFPSAGTARHAEDELKAMLKTIDAWHRENPHFFRNWDGSLPPPEREASEKYKVGWPHPIDWEGWAEYGTPDYDAADAIERAVSSIHNVAFAVSPGETWMGVQPFMGLLEYFGAETAGFDEWHRRDKEKWFFRVTCTAPDEETAQKLKQTPINIDLKLLTIEQHENYLAYDFQLTTERELSKLSAILESNGCKRIHVDLFEKGA